MALVIANSREGLNLSVTLKDSKDQEFLDYLLCKLDNSSNSILEDLLPSRKELIISSINSANYKEWSTFLTSTKITIVIAYLICLIYKTTSVNILGIKEYKKDKDSLIQELRSLI